MRKTATQEELFGRLLVASHPEDVLTSVNEGRADWLYSLGIPVGPDVLDLGCGNGYLDIALARRGVSVLGVDRLVSVLDEARDRAAGLPVQYMSHDLRTVRLEPEAFDLILMFGLMGLMSVEGDRDLLARAHDWLRPGGHLLVDCDLELATDGDSGSLAVEGGVYRWVWTSDSETRYNHLLPEFETSDGTIFEMHDPYEPDRSDSKGLIRYIYLMDELVTMLEEVGFTTTPVGHYVSFVLPDVANDSYMVLCRRED